MKKLAVAAAVVLLVAITATAAFSYGGRWWSHGRGGGGDRDCMALSGLNLTAEQSAKIAAMRESHLKEVKPIQDKLFSKQGDLRLLWMQDNPDAGKIKALRNEIRGLRDQLADKRFDLHQEMLKVLTPEQAREFKSRSRGWGGGPGGCLGGGMGWGHGGRGHMGMGYGPGAGAGMGPCGPCPWQS